MKVHALLVLTAGLLPAADKPEEAVKKDRERIAGRWAVVSREVNGMKVDDELLKTVVVTFKADGTAEVLRDGQKVADITTTTIDPGKKPKELDQTIKTPDGKEQSVKGIYQIEGDDLKICSAAPGKDRPKDFTGKEGSGNTLTVLRRKK
jgi:uncharacterized protein (TIGR03067 family)